MLTQGVMVSADTSAAEAAISAMDAERASMQAIIFEAIKTSTRSLGLTYKQTEALLQKIFEIQGFWYKTKEKIAGDVDTTKESVKKSAKWTMMHVYQMASNAWQLIEMAFGSSKNAASQMISFAISSMTSIISTGYAAASMWAAVPIVGPAMAILSLSVVGINVAQQAWMIASKAGLDGQPGIIGNMFDNFPGGGLG